MQDTSVNENRRKFGSVGVVRLGFLITLFALIGASCGSSGSDDAAAEETTTTEAPAEETTTTEAPAEDRVAGFAGRAFESDPAMVTAGQAVYEGGCAGCHAADGTGVDGRGPALLGNAAFRPDPLVQVGQVINGGSNMPAFGDKFDDDQIEQMIAYIRATFVAPEEGGAEEGAADPAVIAVGLEVYGSSCAGCHGDDGEGSDRGPALEGLIGKYADVADQIAVVTDGGPNNMPAFADKLTPEQIEAVVAYQRENWG